MKYLLIIAFTLFFYSAFACECKVVYSMADNIKEADLIVKVKVLSFNDTLQQRVNTENKLITLSPPFTSGFAPNLKVSKVFKGKLIKKKIALSGTPYCSDNYLLGNEYVLFIYRGDKGSYYTRICENNFGASDGESMKLLRSLLAEQE